MREHGNIKELKQSIEKVGLINPITINQDYELLAGRRRFQATQELGWKEIECQIVNTSNSPFYLFFDDIKNKCEICNYPFADSHHILPKKHGGNDDKSNLIYLCANHHRAIHYLLTLFLIIYSKEKCRKPANYEQFKAIQTYLYLNDQKVVAFFNDYLKEKIQNEIERRDAGKTTKT